MKWKKPIVAIIVAALHFVLSLGLTIWMVQIAMADVDYGGAPRSTVEEAVFLACAIVNFPLLTLLESEVFDLPSDNCVYLLFIVNSILWALVFVLFVPWLIGKFRKKKMPN